MKKNLLPIAALLLPMLAALPAIAQTGPDGESEYGTSRSSGMERGMMGQGMMGRLIAPGVPDKLPAPASREWVQKLRDVLSLERLSQKQYTADAGKFSARMPYMMVIPQEEDHIRAIERLFVAYGLPAASQEIAVTDTRTLDEALELCVKLEQNLIPRYEWLVQHAGDRQSATILSEILAQTRQHLFMFERARRMGGMMR